MRCLESQLSQAGICTGPVAPVLRALASCRRTGGVPSLMGDCVLSRESAILLHK